MNRFTDESPRPACRNGQAFVPVRADRDIHQPMRCQQRQPILSSWAITAVAGELNRETERIGEERAVVSDRYCPGCVGKRTTRRLHDVVSGWLSGQELAQFRSSGRIHRSGSGFSGRSRTVRAGRLGYRNSVIFTMGTKRRFGLSRGATFSTMNDALDADL